MGRAFTFIISFENPTCDKDLLLSHLEQRIHGRDYYYFTKIIIATLSGKPWFFLILAQKQAKEQTQYPKPNLEVVLISISCFCLQTLPLHKRPTLLGVAGMPTQEMCIFLFGDQHLGQPQSSVTTRLWSNFRMKAEVLNKLNKRTSQNNKKGNLTTG